MTDDQILSGPLAALPVFFRAEDMRQAGLTRHQIPSLLRKGLVRRVARGLYRREDLPVTELEGLQMVARMAPEAIFCLLTALRFHEIGTQSPPEFWLAIPNKARAPKLAPWEGRFMRWTGMYLSYGIQERTAQGVFFRITSPARTIVDCFRYRNKVGLDVALEAIRDGIGRRVTTADEVVEAARACRAWTVVKPYLESVLA